MFITVTLVSLAVLVAFFLLISYSRVRVILHRKVKLEITIAFLRLELYNFEKDSKKRPKYGFYRLLYSRLTKLFSVSEVTVEELSLPLGEALGIGAYITPYGYHGAISATLAFLASHSRRLRVTQDAIDLFKTDGKSNARLSLTARTRLFYILKTVFLIVKDKKKTEKEDRIYVGRSNE